MRDRVERLAALAAEHELDALIVGDLVRPGDSGPDGGANSRWLTGFDGTSSLVLVSAEERVFVTDFRYAQMAERVVDPSFERVLADKGLIEAIAPRLERRVGFDDGLTSVRNLRKLESRAPEGVELVAVSGIVERLRRVKDSGEQELISAAARLTDDVFSWLLERGLAGRSEFEVAAAAEARMREHGAEPAFPSIVAAGENSSLPHHSPSEHVISSGELVTIDMGSILDGYCSDCTRTYAIGPAGEEERDVYETVLGAQLASLEAIRAGVTGRDADAAARAVIEEAGHGEHFGHGTGHGVGVEVHEGPRLSTRSEDTLEAGDAVTVEPGVYLPGRFGVRIEDLVIVTPDGYRNLSGLPKELLEVE